MSKVDDKYAIDSYSELINGQTVKVRVFPSGLCADTLTNFGFDPNKNLIKPSKYIKRCVDKHGSRFDYSMTKYTNMKGTISVRCTRHDHTFPVQASIHSKKPHGGCIHCERDGSLV